MYWFRELDLPSMAAFGLLSLAWLAGGWLLASHAFALRRAERLLVGISLGLVLFITLANLLAGLLPGLLPLPLAFWLAGVGVLGLGVAAARFSTRPTRPWLNLRQLALRQLADPLLLAAVALTVLLALIQRGLGIFDDYLHLPLVSTLAAGDIPPHFYLNPDRPFAYHYGLQVLAAGLVRLAGFQPWSAWDLSKALAIALSACLGWFWFSRLTGSRWASLLGSLALILGGGARWLLLLLPQPWLAAISSRVSLHNTGLDAAPNLLAALHSPWPIDGGGPIPFPFAAHNGVFLPLISVLGSTGALPYLTVLLLGLLAVRRRLGWIEGIVFTLLLANLALSAEHWFALLWVALAAVLGAAWARSRMQNREKGHAFARQVVLPWAGVLGVSALLSLVQGGFITEAARSAMQALLGMGGAASSNFYGFEWRWPPAVYSAHLGLLSLFDPAHWVVLLAELGPGLLLAGAASVFSWRAFRRGSWMLGALGLCALLNMLFPIFIVYGVDRSVTRFPATALWLWLMLGLPLAWWAARRAVTGLRLHTQTSMDSPFLSEEESAPPAHSLTRPYGRALRAPSPEGGGEEVSPLLASERPGGDVSHPQEEGDERLRPSPQATLSHGRGWAVGPGEGMAGSPAKRPLPTAMVNLSRVLGKHAMEEEDSHADQRRRHGNQDNKSTTSFAKDGSPVGFAGSVLGSRRPRAVLLLTLLALGYAVLVGGGMVVLGVQAASIPAPQLTYYLDYLDAGMSQAQWNKLEPGAQVLDHIPFRAVTLFGRASTAHDSIYVPLPEWEALVANPDPRQAAQAGYSHIYMDGEWWDGLSPVQRQAFEQPCVDIIEEKAGEGAGVRLLIDIRGCKRGN